TSGGVYTIDLSGDNSTTHPIPLKFFQNEAPQKAKKVSMLENPDDPSKNFCAVEYGSSEVALFDLDDLEEVDHQQVGNICNDIEPFGDDHILAACANEGFCAVYCTSAGMTVGAFVPQSYCATAVYDPLENHVLSTDLVSSPNTRVFDPT